MFLQYFNEYAEHNKIIMSAASLDLMVLVFHSAKYKFFVFKVRQICSHVHFSALISSV